MKPQCLKTSSLLALISTSLFFVTLAYAADAPRIQVALEHSNQTLRMGDAPALTGTITNLGKTPVKGIVVCLSLVSLAPGNEQPVDLEDWSADKAIRIDRLLPGETSTHAWNIRLIQAGTFGVALTAIDPEEKQPTVSPLIRFHVEPKSVLDSKRVLPVAIGEPLLLLALCGAISFFTRGATRFRRVPAE